MPWWGMYRSFCMSATRFEWCFFPLSDGGPTRPEAQWAQLLHLTGILLRFEPWRAAPQPSSFALCSVCALLFNPICIFCPKSKPNHCWKNIPYCGVALQRLGRVGVRRLRLHYRPTPPFDPHPTHPFLQTKPFTERRLFLQWNAKH